MKQPLIMKEGLLQSAGEDRIGIPKLNLGDISIIVVAGNTIQISVVLHRLESNNHQLKTVRYINGGASGDLLLLTGRRVQLGTGGNILQGVSLNETTLKALVNINGEWLPIAP
jgi:hypothetical protein